MNITLYDSGLEENCYRVRLLLSVLKLPYTMVSVDIFAGQDHLAPAMRALNPGGQLPILVDGATTVTAMIATMAHLARRYGNDQLLGDSEQALEIGTWSEFSADELGSARQARLVAMFGPPG